MSNHPSLVMCRPTHFGVQYVINPWMRGQVGRARAEVALQQWEGLHNILSELTDVAVIDGAPARQIVDGPVEPLQQRPICMGAA